MQFRTPLRALVCCVATALFGACTPPAGDDTRDPEPDLTDSAPPSPGPPNPSVPPRSDAAEPDTAPVATVDTARPPTTDAGAAPPSDSAARSDGASRTDSASDAVPPPPASADPTPGTAGPLPVIFIDTGGMKMPSPQSEKIRARFKLVQDHDGNFDWRTLQPISARPASMDATIGINGHGNASWSFLPMKSYNIEFRDAAGMAVDVSLLGMPPHSDWLLYACYNDKPCMRNALAYTWSRQMGNWAARHRYVEVVLDGKYNGMYALMEKIRQDKQRVPIPKPAADETGDVTGGYIWKLDSPVDNPAVDVWKSKGGLTYGYSYPKATKITAAQKKYLQDFLNGFEPVWQGPVAGFAHAQTGYRAWIDVKSFIDYALITELSVNGDGLARSAYFHKQSMPNGNKIFAGPVWDYDLAFGTDLRGGQRTDIWQYRDIGQKMKADFPAVGKIIDLWTRLWEDKFFQDEMKCRYGELRKTVLSNAAVAAHVDGWGKDLAVAEKRHHEKWPVINKDAFGFRDLTQPTWADDLKYLKNFVFARLKFLDEKLPGTCAR